VAGGVLRFSRGSATFLIEGNKPADVRPSALVIDQRFQNAGADVYWKAEGAHARRELLWRIGANLGFVLARTKLFKITLIEFGWLRLRGLVWKGRLRRPQPAFQCPDPWPDSALK